MLHLTNGDAAIDRLRAAAIPGDLIAWRDSLHEGPVRAGRTLTTLSAERAGFIAARGLAPVEVVQRQFTHRDAALFGFGQHDEIVLWFETDLYDQFQLVQILNWFANRDRGPVNLSLVDPSVLNSAEFVGIGTLSLRQVEALFRSRQVVDAAALTSARIAWEAFCAPDPTALSALMTRPFPGLPDLASALHRYFEEFPAVQTGLSRTERQLLGGIASGLSGPADLFDANQSAEAAPFLGDTVVWDRLATLAASPRPLIRQRDDRPFQPPGQTDRNVFLEQQLELTLDGTRVLRGEDDQMALNGIDRWFGGVHLHGHHPRWRWDSRTQQLVGATG